MSEEQVPEDPFLPFLRKAKLEQYWDALVDVGFDDFDDFANTMEEEDVHRLVDLVGMKPGHRMKFLSRWRVQRYGEDSNHSTDQTVSASDIIPPTMPNRIKKLLLPNPSSEKNEFFNMVVKNVYECNHSLMTIPSLETYIINQREVRYKLLERSRIVDKIANDCVDDGKPVDGAYVNIHRFLKAESLTRNDLGKAQNSVVFLKGKKEKFVTKLFSDLRDLKTKLIKSNDVLDWKSNELQFYSHMMKDVKAQDDVVSSHIAFIERLISSSRADKAFSAQIEEKRVERSKQRNTQKAKKDAVQRNRNSAGLVLLLICKSNGDGYSQKARSGDFSFQVCKNDIDFHKFDSLLPKIHLVGLNLLLEEDTFMGSYDSVKKEYDLLVRKKERKSIENAENKERKRRRDEAAKNQKTMHFFAK